MAQLAGLFASDTGGTQTQTFLVGQVTAWAPTPGQITVEVQGVTYVDLLYLADPTSHDTHYSVGAQVLLAVTPGAPIVLGVLFGPIP